jgi:protein-export membrane protein, SecD/SecF family/protein-export membrane protein SecD
MKRNTTLSILLAIGAVVFSLFFLKDSIIFYSKSPQQQNEYAATHPNIFKKIINLGLDIQGGMRFVLEIDRSNLPKEATGDILERAYTVIENRINGLGVAEPMIQKQGKDRIIVELPGFRDEAAATGVIGSTAQLEFNLLREPADLERAIKVIDNTVKGVNLGDTAAAIAKDTVTQKEKEAQQKAAGLFQGKDKAADTSKAKADSAAEKEEPVSSFSELLTSMGEQIAVLENNKAKVAGILGRKDVQDALEHSGLGGSVFLWGHETRVQGSSQYRMLYYVKARAEMKGDAIKDARGSIDRGGMSMGQAIVELEMNSKGARTFARVTAANIGKYLAIVLDSTVYSAPVIRSKIPSGRAQIEGSFTMEEAKNLSVVLRAGALPAPVKIVEQRIVGPSLGQDSVRMGGIASLLGFVLIIVFMVVYYRYCGLIANGALILHLLFVLGMMAAINATLTLPGIAGLILNVGMAVDANVLIYERIREELRLGKTPRSAIEAGYNRAIITIVDTQIVTLITALILLWAGTGPIKGFAITMILGILFTLFTQVVITRAFFNVIPISKDNQLSI